MTETRPESKTPMAGLEQKAKNWSDRSASYFQDFGFSRAAAGALLVLLGALVLIFPALVSWIVGIGALVLGILVLAYAPPLKS